MAGVRVIYILSVSHGLLKTKRAFAFEDGLERMLITQDFFSYTSPFYVCVGSGRRVRDLARPGHHTSAQEKTRLKKMKNS